MIQHPFENKGNECDIFVHFFDETVTDLKTVQETGTSKSVIEKKLVNHYRQPQQPYNMTTHYTAQHTFSSFSHVVVPSF